MCYFVTSQEEPEPWRSFCLKTMTETGRAIRLFEKDDGKRCFELTKELDFRKNSKHIKMMMDIALNIQDANGLRCQNGPLPTGLVCCFGRALGICHDPGHRSEVDAQQQGPNLTCSIHIYSIYSSSSVQTSVWG